MKHVSRHSNPFIQVKYLGRGESEIHKELLEFETKDDMDEEFKKVFDNIMKQEEGHSLDDGIPD